MASQSETNLSCSVCREIFHDPVILPCSHSFCKACWQQWWKVNRAHECPVCRTRTLQSDPPRNLALKTLCECFLAERAERASAGAEPLCGLHAEKYKLFCLDHQQPVCLICLHSEIHANHSIRPIDEAALDYKYGLQDFLQGLREKLKLFNDIKRNFDQTEKDIKLQNKDTERQIKDVFSMLQQFLQKEEKVRIAALREEEKHQSQMLKWKTEAIGKEIAALSGTIRATEEVLGAEDLRFLQNYKSAAERVHQPLPDVPKPIPGALLDMAKHLNNLPFVVLDKMKEMVTSTYEALQPETRTALSAVSRNRFSLALPMRSETPGLNLKGYEPHVPLLTASSAYRISRFSQSLASINVDCDETDKHVQYVQ